ncbi:RNA 2'-phosphotransferase [Lignipirellula cremea]|uniref:Probable RNA 2'-phosphotransferase n=1 Tax=Lignipirellula cremea TaxID=2528010 RepID=A0A518DLJ4_9BACT|nr:RNA 2'-phosphotransferase [Lignipirellula cremea]QDU92696.1 RNA 2'-phosphotransferase [Lignipirellula cremea]
MDDKQRKHLSKFLSLVLRHEPQKIGLQLDPAGWTPIADLLAAFAAAGRPIDRNQLEEVVATNDKKRFAISDDGQRIRANQGHSVAVELGYEPAVPPETLYHGTVARFLPSIREQGLIRGERSHVHLSRSRETAVAVGSRRGQPVILQVQAAAMQAAGHPFFLTPNQVWLTDAVPPEFIEFPLQE